MERRQPDFIFCKFNRDDKKDRTIYQFHFIFNGKFGPNEFIYLIGENSEAEFSSVKFRKLEKLEMADIVTEEDYFEISRYYKYDQRYNFNQNINLLMCNELETVNYRTVAMALKRKDDFV